MRIILSLAIMALLTACAEPSPQASGPAPLPAHPVPSVSQPTSLPPAAGSAATASGCPAKDGCGTAR